MSRTLTIVGALIRASLQTGMQYRSDFLIQGLAGLFRTGAIVLPALLVFHHRDAVMGWTLSDTTLVMGLFLVMSAVLSGVVEPNLGEVVEGIRSGAFDLWLLKPTDAQLLASLRRVQPEQSWTLLGGGVLIGWALMQRGSVPGGLDVVMACWMMLCGIASLYGLWLLAICLSFFFVRVDNLRFLLWSVMDAGRWPLPMFAPWVQWLLTVAVPVGVLTTYPALALRGEWDASVVGTATAVALGFVLGSRLAWNRSIRSYTSASS